MVVARTRMGTRVKRQIVPLRDTFGAIFSPQASFFWFGLTIAPSDIGRIALPVAVAVVFTLTFNVIAGHRRRPDLRLRSPCRLERSPDAPQPRQVRADPRLPRVGGRARQQNRAVRCAFGPGALDPVARARRPSPVLARWLPPRFLAPRGTLQSRRTRRRTSVPMPPTPSGDSPSRPGGGNGRHAFRRKLR
jgi:hypothetical protein